MLVCLTGSPGVGKTTIIKKLVEYLKIRNVAVGGFFTEEIRDAQGDREGFDIVTINNQRGVLARKNGLNSKFKVGTYFVNVDKFEDLALPSFSNPHKIMIIDEVGKMELFSKLFKEAIENLLTFPDVTIVATVPLKSNDTFINHLRKDSTKLLHVTKANRSNQVEKIIELLNI